MRYITSSEAARQKEISVRRIQQMCKKGELAGAVKQGRSWLIPVEENITVGSIRQYDILPASPANRGKSFPVRQILP